MMSNGYSRWVGAERYGQVRGIDKVCFSPGQQKAALGYPQQNKRCPPHHLCTRRARYNKVRGRSGTLLTTAARGGLGTTRLRLTFSSNPMAEVASGGSTAGFAPFPSSMCPMALVKHSTAALILGFSLFITSLRPWQEVVGGWKWLEAVVGASGGIKWLEADSGQ